MASSLQDLATRGCDRSISPRRITFGPSAIRHMNPATNLPFVRAALNTSGALPENVNYAVKSSFLLGFLESVPEASANLKEPNTKELRIENVVRSAEQPGILLLVH